MRKIDNRIRLTAQLINIEDGYHIWSQTYDRELNDIFAIQDEVANHIATALVESFAGLSTRWLGGRTVSQHHRPTGRDVSTGGGAHRAELQRAIELFATALEHDARFAPAYAAMADTWLLLSIYGNIDTMKATRKAEAMIEKALEIDPGSEEAFAALGLARWQIGQMDAAESALRQAVELNENYVPAQLWLAGLMGQQGRYPEESQVLEKAMALDPLNELLAVNYSKNLAVRGNWAEGKELMQGLIDCVRIPPYCFAPCPVTSWRLETWWKAGVSQTAPGCYSRMIPEDISVLAQSWVLLGNVEEAERIIREGLEKSGQERQPSSHLLDDFDGPASLRGSGDAGARSDVGIW